MLITSSLGAGVARIVRNGDSVVLTTAEPREYRASDAEALTEEVLGFRLPLSGLADWVREGLRTRPPQRRTMTSRAGCARSRSAAGKSNYQEYDGKPPSRMRLTYPDIELRLAISKWQ